MPLTQCYECGKEISSLATACPACGAAARPRNRSPLQKLLILGFIGFVVYAVYDTIKRQSAQQRSTPTSLASAAATPEQAPISWSEVDSIYNLRSRNTDLQKKEEWKRFQGKRVRWSGTVTSISDGWTGPTLQVKMNPDTFTSDLLIRLTKSEKSKALQLHQGDQVTFTGNIDNWGTLLPITISDGEIIE